MTRAEAEARYGHGCTGRGHQPWAERSAPLSSKFQVVPGALAGEKTPGQVSKQLGIHPNSVRLWEKQFLERGAGIFSQVDTVQEHERRLADPEQLPGRKEVEVALLRKHPRPEWMTSERKVALAREADGGHGLAPVIRP